MRVSARSYAQTKIRWQLAPLGEIVEKPRAGTGRDGAREHTRQMTAVSIDSAEGTSFRALGCWDEGRAAALAAVGGLFLFF